MLLKLKKYKDDDSVQELVLKNRFNLNLLLTEYDLPGLQKVVNDLIPAAKANQVSIGELRKNDLKSEAEVQKVIARIVATEHAIASEVSKIVKNGTDLKALESQVNQLTASLSALKGLSNYRGTYATEADVLAIANPKKGDYALMGAGPFTEYVYDTSWEQIKSAGNPTVHPGTGGSATFADGASVHTQSKAVTNQMFLDLAAAASSADLDVEKARITTNKDNIEAAIHRTDENEAKNFIDSKGNVIDFNDLKSDGTTKADGAGVTEGYLLKVMDDEVQAFLPKLALKASKTYVDTELAKKVNMSHFVKENGKKASKTYVDNELSNKADASSVSLKADKTYVDSEINKIPKAPEMVKKTIEVVSSMVYKTPKFAANDIMPILDIPVPAGKKIKRIINFSYDSHGDWLPKRFPYIQELSIDLSTQAFLDNSVTIDAVKNKAVIQFDSQTVKMYNNFIFVFELVENLEIMVPKVGP